MRHKTLFSRPLSGSRTVTVRSPRGVPGKVDKICGGHGQGETPGPIPNPEAKALHGDGTAPERVWESSAPPLSHDTDPRSSPLGLPGVSRFPPRTHARAGRRSPHPADAGPSPPHIFIFIHSFIFIHIHSFPSSPSSRRSPAAPSSPLSVHPSCGGAPGAHGDGGARAPADTESCRAGPACPRTGPTAGRTGGENREDAAGRPCAVSVMDRRRGYAVHTSSERMTECV